MKGTVVVVEIKCPKCGYIQIIKGGENNISDSGALRAPASIEDHESLTISK
jgi:hypothetical protein